MEQKTHFYAKNSFYFMRHPVRKKRLGFPTNFNKHTRATFPRLKKVTVDDKNTQNFPICHDLKVYKVSIQVLL